MEAKKALINILYLNPAGHIGGAEQSLMDLAVHLPHDTFRPLIGLLGPGLLAEECEKRGLECREILLPALLRRVSRGKISSCFFGLLFAPCLILPVLTRLVMLVRNRRIGVIHTNGLKAHLLGCVVSLLTGRILIWHFRVLPEGWTGHLLRITARLFPKRIIAVSNAVKDHLGGLEKIRVVYDGLDSDRLSGPGDNELARGELGIVPADLVIGTVGYFAPLKGYGDLIEAMPLILKELPRAKFLVVGESVYPAYRGYGQWLRRRVADRGLSAKVVFAGFRSDLPGIFSPIDIFVLPSISEGFGRANLEAMAAGKPVVSTRVGGIPEVAIDGETGYLVPPGRPDRLAEAVIRLGRDRELRAKMGEAGKRRSELFTVEKMVKGVTAVYQEVWKRQ